MEANSGCSKSLEAGTGPPDPFGLEIMYQNSDTHHLCIWLKVKPAKLRQPGQRETDSACLPVTVSFPGRALPLAEGHKEPIVLWLLVPWAEWRMTRARPKGEEGGISCQHPLYSQHSHQQIHIPHQLSTVYKGLFFPYLREQHSQSLR